MGRITDIIGPTGKLKWDTLPPAEPGYYWIAEDGEPLHLVQLNIVFDSHSMLEVMLPDDDMKYPVEMWPEALWCGPVKST